MKPTPSTRLLLAGALLLASWSGLSAAEKLSPAFHDLPFEAAGPKAAAEQKIVFVDFYTTWCGPCKMLDQTTWQDAKVIELLQTKTVALKIDAEQQAALARRYKIEAYPTLLLLQPDGTELDRLVGYREPAKFIAEFTAGLAGKTAAQRAQEAVTTAPDEHERVQARYRLGDSYAEQGKPAEALAEYLWCFDEGMVKEPSFVGVRVSFLLGSISRLAQKYPPARAALEERRDKAKAAFLAGATDRGVIRDLVALNRTLGADADNAALYEQLPAGDTRRQIIGFSLRGKFLMERRYGDALAAEPYDRMQFMLSQIVQQANQPPQGLQAEEIQKMMHRRALTNFAERIEILAGAGDLAHARELLAKAQEFDRSEAAQAVYREHLQRAGHPELLSTVPETK